MTTGRLTQKFRGRDRVTRGEACTVREVQVRKSVSSEEGHRRFKIVSRRKKRRAEEAQAFRRPRAGFNYKTLRGLHLSKGRSV